MSHTPIDSTPSSRKRQRTELSQEDRKEARAHRNRIAAQTSRDKRKAHFAYLERRVAELEEENRQLRAGATIPSSSSSLPTTVPSTPWESENAELKDRIRSLENRWDAVMKVLAVQGLDPDPSFSSSSLSPTITASTTHTTPDASPSLFPLPVPAFSFESTRHLARVATIEASPPSMSLQRVDSQTLTPRDTPTTPSPTPLPPPPLAPIRTVRPSTISSVRFLLRRPRSRPRTSLKNIRCRGKWTIQSSIPSLPRRR
jgi:Basic region leucine zipper